MGTPYNYGPKEIETIRATYRRVVVPSKYIENIEIEKDIYTCPRCNNDLIGAEHAKETTCHICGLHVTVLGGMMEIWE